MATTQTKPAATRGVQQTPEPTLVDNLPAPRPRQGAVNAIVPQSWQEVASIASAICRANMAPKSYLDKEGNPVVDKVAVAIMHGMEVGMTPMASLQSLAVINGMPSLYGDGLLAVVRASGLLEDIQETDEWDAKGPVKAVCRVKRRGEPTWGEQTCARDDAMKAGWWGKSGPWTLTPHRMMQMRARGWALRDKFADVLRGLRSAEEMEDLVDVTPQGSATTAAPPEPRRDDPQFTKSAEVDAKASPVQTADAGQSDTISPSDGGGNSRPEAAATPAHDPETGEIKQTVTDAVDLNQEPSDEIPTDPEPLTFETYKTFGDLIEFSEHFLSQTGRTPKEAEQWHEHYKKQLEYGVSKKYGNAKVAAAINDLLALYGKVLVTQDR